MNFEQEKAVLEAVGCLHAFKDMLVDACNAATASDAETSSKEDVEAFFAKTLGIMNRVYEQATTATVHLGEALSRANPSKPKMN